MTNRSAKSAKAGQPPAFVHPGGDRAQYDPVARLAPPTMH